MFKVLTSLSIIFLSLFSFGQYYQQSIKLSTDWNPTDISLLEIDKQIDRLSKEIAQNSSNPQLYIERGLYYRDLNYLAASLHDFQLAKEKASTLKVAEIDFMIGDIYFRMGEVALAEKYYRRSLDGGFQSKELNKNLLILFFRSEQFDKLFKQYEQNPDVHENMLFALILKGDHSKVQEHFKKYEKEIIGVSEDFRKLVEQPEDYESQLSLMVNCHQHGLILSGIELSKRMLELYPDSSDVHAMNGYFYALSGNPEASVKVLKEALMQFPKAPKLYYHLGGAYDAIGKSDKAIDAYTKGLAISRDGELYHDRGIVFLNSGQAEKAYADFLKADALLDGYHETVEYLGIVNKNQRADLDSAMFYFDRVLSSKPDFYRTYFNMAGLHLYQGNIPEAKYMARKALSLHANYLKAFEMIAQIGMTEENQVSPCMEFLEVAGVNPSISQVKNVMSYCPLDQQNRLANASNFKVYKGKLGKDVADLEEWLNAIPDDAQSLFNLINIKYQYLKEFDETFMLMRKLESILSDDAERAQVKSLKGAMHKVWVPNPDSCIYEHTQSIALGNEAWKPYSDRGFMYLKTGKYELALADLVNIRDNFGLAYSGSPQYSLGLLECQLKLSKWKEAKVTAMAIIENYPRNINAMEALVQINSKIGGVKDVQRLESSIALFTKYVK